MKKLIAFLLCLIVVVPVFAKNDKDRNEFSVVYGQFTVPQFAYVMGEVFGVMFSLGHASFENPHMYGAAGIEYVHYTNDWFGFGGTVLCDYMTAKTVSVDKDGNKTPNGDFKFQAGRGRGAVLRERQRCEGQYFVRLPGHAHRRGLRRRAVPRLRGGRRRLAGHRERRRPLDVLALSVPSCKVERPAPLLVEGPAFFFVAHSASICYLYQMEPQLHGLCVNS